MDKQSLNWLAKEWLNRVAVSSRSGYAGRSYVNPDTRKIFSMMDTSKKRIANPGPAIRDEKYKELVRDNLSDKDYISQIGANRIVTEDIPNLRNEYARMFLVKAMKNKGSIDELAVRQFVKENPKMVEQLLVKNDAIPAGLNARDIASRLSQMYPDGMIKGPVAYERGITGYAQRQFDKTKGLTITNNPLEDEHLRHNNNSINIYGKRKSPISFLHESDESFHWNLLPDNKKMISQFYSGDSIYNSLKDVSKNDMAAANRMAFNYFSDPKNIIGSHVSPGVLVNEKHVLSKIPRFIDPLQKNIDGIRSFRDRSNEYSTIGKRPEFVHYNENTKIYHPVFFTDSANKLPF